MAEERELREVNLILLSRLNVAQKTIWRDLNAIRKESRAPHINKNLRNSQTTPSTSRQNALSNLSALIIPNSRNTQVEKVTTRLQKEKENDDKANRTPVYQKKRPCSILRKPQSRDILKDNNGTKPRILFSSSVKPKNLDQSLLGYDWIAGMLDNNSYISEKDDGFFNDLSEFRQVNRSDCIGSSILFTEKKFRKWLSQIFRNQGKYSQPDIVSACVREENVHKCTDTYVLDERLFPVPIHGSDSNCTVCNTDSVAYDDHESYVRISVPRSTLQSPYRAKPHRRKSFDPTDSVALSKHCLLGWQSSKPAIIPSQSSMDLRAHARVTNFQHFPHGSTALQPTNIHS